MTQQTYPAGEDAKVWFITGMLTTANMRLYALANRSAQAPPLALA